MIDPRREQTVTLTEAARFVQQRFGGKKPSLQTMARWCLQGLRGQRLDSLKRGGQRVTSEEAVIRFFQGLSNPFERDQNELKDRDQRQDRIEQELIARGL